MASVADETAGSRRLDRQLAWLIAAVTLGLLLREVVRDLLPSDAGEFHFAAWNWGLAHPTGYPLYLLAGGLWQRLGIFFGISPALSLNALSAVFAAAAAGLFYLLLRRWLPGPPLIARLAAVLGVAFLVANPTVRTQSVQAEVYTLHLLFLVAILLAADRYLSAIGTNAALRRFGFLGLLVGLALTHHATTFLLLPPLAAWFFAARPAWWRPWRIWLWALPAALLPLLLYLYIPLRSGPNASPWYHQRLGAETLALYSEGWGAFLDFISGRSISVGYYGLNEALGGVPTAAVLWLRHYEWPGLALAAIGVYVLVRLRSWPLLVLTGSCFALQQLFNLFYAIGDIFVYYIPLYLLASIWIACGAAGIGAAFRWPQTGAPAGGLPGAPLGSAADASIQTRQRLGVVLLVILFWLPLGLWTRYTPLIEQLQAESVAARGMWETILAAHPPANAVLVSNDRNEIVPLFYLQTIEERATGNTGLFPLIAPDARFADIGTTVQTALDASSAADPPQPVFLIKDMPGLEARFRLAPAAPPLVAVTGAAAETPTIRTDIPYGPLRLLGYDREPAGAAADAAPSAVTGVLTGAITLHWEVIDPLPGDYTTTVQVFDANGDKLAQDDRRAGGDYYPTTLWKSGEVILDRHPLVLPAGAEPARLLIGMYSGPDASLLAPPLELALQQN